MGHGQRIPTSDACASSPGPDGSARLSDRSGDRLVLISTPIGNLGDISRRAVEALSRADLVLCEDTRTTGRLLSALGIRARTEALHEHNEDERIAAILKRLAVGETVALVSDAGTPLVSDPGYRLVRAAISVGHAVTAVPGPNAAVTALTTSCVRVSVAPLALRSLRACAVISCLGMYPFGEATVQ